MDSQRYTSSAPLGGTVPVPEDPPRVSDVRELVTAGVLMVAAIVTALASLMSWRDFGRGLNPSENGWTMADGSFGRGWVVIIVAVVLAVAGVLLVVGRRSAGRIWARVGTAALLVGPVLEWAFGSPGSRTGPGIGIWVMFGTGLVLWLVLGMVLPHEDPRRPAAAA